jgi:hypothetical protein
MLERRRQGFDALRCQFGVGPMQEFVARENIRRFEAQLAACKNEEQRDVLSRLLEKERRALADALAAKEARPEAS